MSAMRKHAILLLALAVVLAMPLFMRSGSLASEVLIFVLVGVGHIIDTQALGGAGTVRTAVIFFYLSNEGVSILENTAHLGLPIPGKLRGILEQLNDKDEDGEDV